MAKKKSAAVEALPDQLEDAAAQVVAAEPEAPSPVIVEDDAHTPEVLGDVVLIEVHERDDGWWGARILLPGFPEANFHAPHRGGVEAAARAWCRDNAISQPVHVVVV